MKGIWVILLLLLVACTVQDDTEQQISKATEKGLEFLKLTHSPYYFEDAYLKFLYSGENLECPIEGCTLSYRHLDAYFNIIFMQESIQDTSIISEQVIEANNVLDSIMPIWRKDNINNVATSLEINGDNLGKALDSSCILGVVKKDKGIATNIKRYLKDNNWMDDKFYTGDVWRNTADEAWCIQLLLRTGEPDENVKPLLDKMLTEVGVFIDEDHTDVEDLAVVLHMVYVLSDVRDYAKLDYGAELIRYTDFLSWYADKKIVVDNNLMTANMLHALVIAEFDNIAILEQMSQDLLSRQHPDGKWTMTSAPENPLPVFTTSRVLVGINTYKSYRAKNKDKLQ